MLGMLLEHSHCIGRNLKHRHHLYPGSCSLMWGQMLKEVMKSGVMGLVRTTLLEIVIPMQPVAGVLPIKGPEKIQLCLSGAALLQRGAE